MEERALRVEFSRIDADARAICPEDDESKQVYAGTVGDVLKATDVALNGAAAIERRLEALQKRSSAPLWIVASLASAGSIYDCIWSSLGRATPTYLTPQQQSLLTKLQQIGQQVAQRTGNPLVLQQVAQTAQMIQTKWQETRDKYIGVLETKMVARYVSAALPARRYGLEGFAFTHAHQRLPVVAARLGASRMKAILDAMPDPTDPMVHPEDRRHIQYFDGAFVR
jgi:hypothetical protein